MLKIFGEDGTVEEVYFSFNETYDDSRDVLSPDVLLDTSPTNVTKRWATYPNSYFSSDLLIPYSPSAVVSPPSTWEDTSFADTSAYLRQGAPHYIS